MSQKAVSHNLPKIACQQMTEIEFTLRWSKFKTHATMWSEWTRVDSEKKWVKFFFGFET